ncbi:Protein FAR-RED ELONGATED HYPOCOTYL 3 [Frankliniella fusca]|uniref:Protein FAR-RED ELONGATED HYPOCOTYL 3 n=1 Tax=Frankliniella fusca TaxID=407009 RepID=A0AAE1HRT8_9NEOP|nr:Protein FAR-RED ELONGATED HYPOCOTYL 3 [Frankliniella fusca]
MSVLGDITHAALNKANCNATRINNAGPLILKVIGKPHNVPVNFTPSLKTVIPVRFVGRNTLSSHNTQGSQLQVSQLRQRQDADLLQTRQLFNELGESEVVLPPVVVPTTSTVDVFKPNIRSISTETTTLLQKGSQVSEKLDQSVQDEVYSELSDEDFIPKKKSKHQAISTNNNDNCLESSSDPTPRQTPNCRKTAAQIEAAILTIENESKSHPLFNKYHDLIPPSTFDYVLISLQEQSETQKNSTNDFRAVLRLRIFKREEADLWLQEFEDLSSSDYRVRDCKKENSDRLVLKRIFRCHHNIPKVNKTVPENSNEKNNKINIKRSKDTSCKATLRITIKQDMKWSSDDLIKKYPCEIIIDHKHNHPIIAKEALRFRRPTKRVEEKFKTLFGQGHSPSSAVEIHRFELQTELGDGYLIAAADRSKCPDVKWASRLYYKIFRKVYGEPHGEEMVASLEDFIRKFNESQGSKCAVMQKLDEKDLIVAICTPLMKRIHSRLRSAGEIMFVDSSGTMDVLNTRVFVLLCPSIAGALPLGILLVSSEAEMVIKAALDLWMSLLPDDNSFGGRGKQGPKIIMTDDSSAERNSLRAVFPDSVLLLCIFHVLQAYWRYVWNTDHKVDKNDRADVYFPFRETLYCLDPEEFKSLWAKMIDLPAVKNNPYLVKHLNDLKSRVPEWALHMRTDLLVRGHNTNNYAEATMRILKDLICHRTKAFSPVQLLDFLVTRYVSYLERRIVDVINNRVVNSHRSRYFITPKKLEPLKCHPLSRPHTYLVENNSKGTKYFVNMIDEICSCPVGRNGATCKHQCAVVRDFNVPSTQVQNFSHHEDPKLKQDLFHIVYGSSAKLPQDWFAPLIPLASQHQDNSGDNSTSDMNAACIEFCSEYPPSTSSVDDPLSSSSEHQRSPQANLPDEELLSISKDMFSMVESWVRNLKSRPEIYADACRAILKSNGKLMLGGDSALVSALHTFGKQTGHKAINGGLRIPVNSAAIARRGAYLEGGRNPTITGRPSKAMMRKIPEHNFATPVNGKKEAFWHEPPRKRGAAPHSLTTCTERRITLGKTHSRK